MSNPISVLQYKIIDNRQVSMQHAFKEFLPRTNHMDLAVGYFYLSGFSAIEEEVSNFIEKGGTIRILMGNVTDVRTGFTIHEGYELKFTKDLILSDLKRLKKHDEYSLAHKLKEWIAEGKINVKVYTGDANYFHAKTYLFYREAIDNKFDGYSIVGSSNFTSSGLIGNTELNSVSQDNFGALTNWFEEVWNSREVSDFSKDLLNFINKEVPKPFSDSQVYMSPRDTYLTFSRYFAKRLPEEIDGEFMRGLYAHQKIGVSEIKHRLEQYGTAILCDGVGLGKTRTAAAVIYAIEAKNVLIIASKKLHNQWENELAEVKVDRARYRIVSKEDIARREVQGMKEYIDMDLVIIDEAHQGLKNNRTKLYRNLAYLKERGGNKTKGLLLTATPWNNSRSDIFNLGRLFLSIRNVPSFSDYYSYLYCSYRKAAKAISLDDKAFRGFWRDLFLQRTKKTYGGDDVQYATRIFPVIEINYEPIKEKIFAANGDRISRLYLPYMNPIRYVDVESYSEFAADRLKLLFLKRADSSWNAFRITLDRVKERLEKLKIDLMAIQNSDSYVENFKEWLRRSYELDVLDQNSFLDDTEGIEEVFPGDTLSSENYLGTNKHKYIERLEKKIKSISTEKYEEMIGMMLQQTESDLYIINQILEELGKAFDRKDEKYEKVRDTILDYLKRGEKVLLISQFRATVNNYYRRFINDPQLKEFRMGCVTGVKEDLLINEEPQLTKEVILESFSPRSKKKLELVGTEEEIQLLIGTETLSVGQNLQDCRVLMNLDLPYNPMVLEQRIGRIDRPREENQPGEINIITFPSMPVIEAELKMTERLKAKLEGIYEDTKFDDLVLPQYREFLENVLKKRKIQKQDVEGMMTSAIKATIVSFTAEEHSSQYIESQRRMRRAIEENKISNDNIKFFESSFSNANQSTAVLSIVLKDVNGNKIDNYLYHVSLNNSQLDIENELSIVEGDWYDATNYPVLTEGQLPLEEAKLKVIDLKQKIRNIILNEEVKKYNKSLSIEEDLDSKLVEKKVQQLVVEITNEIMGRNKVYIAKKIKAAGFEPKSVQSLIKAIQYLDKNYDIHEMKLVDVLYQNIEKLWDDYGYYYEALVKDEQLEVQEVSMNKSIRAASYENSEIELVVGNIGVLNG